MILICFYFIYLQEEAPLQERDPGETIKASPMFTLEDVFKSENRYDGDSVGENDLIDGEDYNLPGMDEEDYNSHGMDEEHDFEFNSNVYPTNLIQTYWIGIGTLSLYTQVLKFLLVHSCFF